MSRAPFPSTPLPDELAPSGARVLSPCDVRRESGLDGRVVRIGGRLIRDPDGWRLADAFDAIGVELTDPSAAGHACIAILEGTLRAESLVGAGIVQQQRLDTMTLPPEFQRLFERGVGQRLQVRARILAEVRQFFAGEGFIEVDTPIRSVECGTETHVEPLTCSGGYLITSPELHMKRLLVAGVPKSFQLVHCFRAGELGPLHSPEFLMLEWYRAFTGFQAMLWDTEQLLHTLARRICSSSILTLPSGANIDLTPPFARLSVRDAFARFAGVADAAALAQRDEDQYFQLLVDRVEPALAGLGQPVFLFDYPATQAALARVSPTDPSVAERFELYLGGIELCNGYGELNDAAEQRARCELDRQRRRALGRSVPDAPARFLSALEQGMPPASGNALGMDRLIALLCREDRIDAVCAFAPDSA